MEYQSWSDIVIQLQSTLKPNEFNQFQKRVKQFNSYKSQELLIRMYQTIFDQNLQYVVNCHRVNRLKVIWKQIQPYLNSQYSLLEVGAGTGVLSEAVREFCQPKIYHVIDVVPSVMTHLQGLGFTPYSEVRSYDIILMIDVLGEVNMDEDNAILENLENPEAQVGELLEARYGFAHQLSYWKSSLAPLGKILFFEPFVDKNILGHLGQYLSRQGWQVKLLEDPLNPEGTGLILQIEAV